MEETSSSNRKILNSSEYFFLNKYRIYSRTSQKMNVHLSSNILIPTT